MNRRAKAKPRKPRYLELDGWFELGCEVATTEWPAGVYSPSFDNMGWSASRCRRLAAWLLRAADWLEAQDGK